MSSLGLQRARRRWAVAIGFTIDQGDQRPVIKSSGIYRSTRWVS